ncbi:MAG: hypothetical protein U0Y10_13200 [Spirosomataceae bacterium]
MKRILLFLSLLASTQAFSQAIFYGSQEFDKVKKNGLYTLFSIDKKYIEKGWRLKLAEFGKVIVTKDVYSVTSAAMPTIAENPINLISKVTTQKGKTLLFMALNLQDSLYIDAQHPKYAEAEKVMNSFIKLMEWEESVRKAEDEYADVQKAQDKVIRQGERLVDKIESNKKDKEKILKKIDDNKAEYEQLNKDLPAAQDEQKLATEDMDKLKTANPAEKELKEAQKKVEKAGKKVERINKDIESNLKEKEKLPRKLDENKIELDKLTLDLEQNKKDQIKAAETVDREKKELDAIKAKKPVN